MHYYDITILAVFGQQQISIIVTFIFIFERNLSGVLGNKSALFCSAVIFPPAGYFYAQHRIAALALAKEYPQDKYSCGFSDIRYFMGLANRLKIFVNYARSGDIFDHGAINGAFYRFAGIRH